MNGRSLRNIYLGLLLVFGLVVAVSVSALEQDEARFGALLNAERSNRGLSVLKPDVALLAVARSHSEEMARAGRIYHNSSLGSQVTGWLVLGENVGRGRTVDPIHVAFMESTVHREQILFPKYRGYAVGTANADGYIWVTELFILPEKTQGLGPIASTPKKAENPEPEIVYPGPVFIQSINSPPVLTLPLRLEVQIQRREATLPLAALAFLLLVVDAHFLKLIASRSFRRRMMRARRHVHNLRATSPHRPVA